MFTTPETGYMFWTNPILKRRALDNMRGRVKQYLGIGLLYILLTSLMDTLFTLLEVPGFADVMTWLQINNMRPALEELMTMPGMDQALLQEYQAMLRLHLTRSQIIGGCLQGAASLLLTIFVYNVLTVGYNRWLMEARCGQPGASTLFSVFNGAAQWGGIAWVQFVIVVKTVLWSMLLFIPGIVFAYKTCLVPFLLAENPYMTQKRAIQLSNAMTHGEKLRIFMLQFSFFGWSLLLGLVTSIASALLPVLGVVVSVLGSVALTAYLSAAMAELYACMREKALRSWLADSRELGGFAAL